MTQVSAIPEPEVRSCWTFLRDNVSGNSRRTSGLRNCAACWLDGKCSNWKNPQLVTFWLAHPLTRDMLLFVFWPMIRYCPCYCPCYCSWYVIALGGKAGAWSLPKTTMLWWRHARCVMHHEKMLACVGNDCSWQIIPLLFRWWSFYCTPKR